MTAGIESVICSGAEELPLVRLASGERVGSRFVPPASRLDLSVHGAPLPPRGANSEAVFGVDSA